MGPSSKVVPSPTKEGTDNAEEPSASSTLGEPKTEDAKASLAQLFQYTSPLEKALLVVSAVAATVSGAAMPAMLFAFGDLMDMMGATSTVEGSSALSSMVDNMLSVLYIQGAVMIGCTLLYSWVAEHVCQSMLLRYKKACLKAVLRQDVGWYDASNPEELSTRLAMSITQLQKGLGRAAFQVFDALGYGASGFAAAFYFQPAVAGITLATGACTLSHEGMPWGAPRTWRAALRLPLLIVPAIVLIYVLENGSKIVSAAYSTAGGIATEALFSMRTVASLGIERDVEERYRATLARSRDATVRNAVMQGASMGAALSAYLVMVVAGVLYGGFVLADEMEASAFDLVVDGITYCAHPSSNVLTSSLTSNATCPAPLVPFQLMCSTAESLSLVGVGTVGFDSEAAFRAYAQATSPVEYVASHAEYYDCKTPAKYIILAIFAVMMAGEGASAAGQPAQNIVLARQAAASILAIIARVPTINSFSEEGARPSGCRGEVEVRDVVFAYPTAPQRVVCDGYSLAIPAGKTVALCGPSGSGKSTIIALIERFYDPQEGAVLLDGVDVRTLNVRWLRSQLGLVGQEPVLFHGSVAMNIGYGKPAGEVATQEEIEEAAKMANAHGFITESLGEGYLTEVGQGGGKLSGGQKQRVAIARALIKKPAVLLLDEATSALDNESEKVVQAAIDDVMAQQKLTTIVIAHRLTTIRHADTIAVISEGRVAESGTHDELVARGGLYHKLVNQQQPSITAATAAGSGSAADGVARARVAAPSVDVPTTPSGVAVQAAAAGLPSADGAASSGAKASGESVTVVPAKAEAAPIHRVLRMQADHSGQLLLMVLFSGVATVGPSIAFYEFTFLTTALYNPSVSGMRTDITTFSIILAALAGGIILCFTLSGRFNGVAGAALTLKLRARGMHALLRQDIGFFDAEENSASDLTAFLADKVEKVRTITTEKLDLIAQLLGGVGSAVFIIFYFCSWQLALLFAAIAPILATLAGLQSLFLSGGAQDASAGTVVGECILGIRTVASFNLEERFYNRFCERASSVASCGKRDAVVVAFFSAMAKGATVYLLALIMWYAVWLANHGVIDLVAAMGPMFVITGAMVPLQKAEALASLKEANVAAVRLFRLFDRKPAVDASDPKGARPSGCRGEVEVRDVVFAYPTAPQRVVCDGYSLAIPAGKTVALCGPSGSGKSTIIALIERFYDPQEGAVLLDGVDVRTLNVRWLRSQLGLVGQEPVLFHGSVAMNIGYGKPAGEVATQEEIEEAAKMANAHGFITESLGEGYLTQVGLRGGKLSGGQKQRVAIARALIKKPAVLLLDEATSALDNESEKVVQAAIDDVMAQQKLTTIVIAHRLTTIRHADTIAVISEGRVAESGTHDELVARGGLYHKLALSC